MFAKLPNLVLLTFTKFMSDTLQVCRFYQSGHCRAGNSCRFRHEDAPNSGSELAEANGVLHFDDLQIFPPADEILDSDDLEYISREYLPELDEYAR